MTQSQQILHILRKDVRGHWSEIASVVILNLLVVALSTETWTMSVERSVNSPVREIAIAVAGIVLVLAWCLLIARVVQAESPATRSQHWVTRPYSRMSLMLSKLLFILIFVHALNLISQLTILIVSGVPFLFADLIVNQLLFAAVISLPVAGVASLTKSLRGVFLSAIPLILFVLALGVLRYYDYAEIPVTYGGNYFNIWFSIADPFIRAIAGAVVVAVIAAATLFAQYRSRQQLAIARRSAAALMLIGILVAATPKTIIMRIEGMLVGDALAVPSITLRSPTDEGGFNYYDYIWSWGRNFREPPEELRYTIDLPISFADNGAWEVQFLNGQATLRTASGTEVIVDAVTATSFGGGWVRFEVPADFLDRFADEPVTVALEFDVRQLSGREAEPIPLAGGQVIVDDTEQCGPGYRVYLLCRGSFRGFAVWGRYFPSPQRAVHGVLSREMPSIPFTLNPIAKSELRPFSVGNERYTERTLPSWIVEPVSIGHLAVSFENLLLSDWSVLTHIENAPPPNSR